MGKAQRNLAAVTTKLPKERLALLDDFAVKVGVSRSALVRSAVETMLEDAGEELDPAAERAIQERRLQAFNNYRLGEIKKRVRVPARQRLADALAAQRDSARPSFAPPRHFGDRA